MTLKIKIYIALGCVTFFAACWAIGTLWADARLKKAERDVRSARAYAEAADVRSRELETAAAEYKEKIRFLEGSLSGLRRIAAEQNENIKTLQTASHAARHDADRARSVRRVESTAAELCRQLADLGHPCD